MEVRQYYNRDPKLRKPAQHVTAYEISLLSILSKVSEKLLQNTIQRIIGRNEIIPPNHQFSFQTWHSTMQQQVRKVTLKKKN